MDIESIIRVLKEGLLLVLLLSIGPMMASLVTGLVVSVLQAVTQVQEPTLSYVPKLIAVFATLAALGGWMLALIVHFTQAVFDNIVLAH
ncbi:MAG TPA: flagellar biosynthesis protein FliQ [Terriglobales bacterium]